MNRATKRHIQHAAIHRVLHAHCCHPNSLRTNDPAKWRTKTRKTINHLDTIRNKVALPNYSHPMRPPQLPCSFGVHHQHHRRSPLRHPPALWWTSRCPPASTQCWVVVADGQRSVLGYGGAALCAVAPRPQHFATTATRAIPRLAPRPSAKHQFRQLSRQPDRRIGSERRPMCRSTPLPRCIQLAD